MVAAVDQALPALRATVGPEAKRGLGLGCGIEFPGSLRVPRAAVSRQRQPMRADLRIQTGPVRSGRAVDGAALTHRADVVVHHGDRYCGGTVCRGRTILCRSRSEENTSELQSLRHL